MATIKIKTKKGDPTPQQLAAANAFARNFAMRKGLVTGENTNVGNQIPKFIDAISGRELPPDNTANQYAGLPTKVPLYVKELQWDAKQNLPYYIDEKTGDAISVHPDLFHLPRFNPNRGKLVESLSRYVKK